MVPAGNKAYHTFVVQPFYEKFITINIMIINPLTWCSICIPPWKRQKAKDFLTFSGGIEIEHWAKMGY